MPRFIYVYADKSSNIVEQAFWIVVSVACFTVAFHAIRNTVVDWIDNPGGKL